MIRATRPHFASDAITSTIPDYAIVTKSDEQAIEQGCYWDDSYGTQVISFFDTLTVPSTGEPFELFPIQRQLIHRIYSWRRKDGKRRHRRVFITSGKKALGKSLLVSGLSLYHLLHDGVQSPLVILGGPTRENANELFKDVLFFTRNNPELHGNLGDGIVESLKYIKYPDKNGMLKTVSREALSKGGWRCTFVALDEMSLHQDDKLYTMLKGSMIAASEPLLVMLSNAGYDKSHFYYTQIYKPCKDILTGELIDLDTLPIIYEAPEGADWKDKTVWASANPLAQELQLDFEDDYKDAERTTQGLMYFNRFRLNRWTKTKTAWIDLGDWDKCKASFPPLHDKTCFVGIDLARTNNLISICACYPIGDRYFFKTWNFCTRESLKKVNSMHVDDFRVFEANGNLIMVDGNCFDYSQVRDTIKRIPGQVRLLVFDKYSSVETTQILEKEGFDILSFPQSTGYYNEVCRKFEVLLLDKKLAHDGDLCLRWCLGNTQLETDKKGMVMPTKNQYALNDAACACLMALSQAYLPASQSTSAYSPEMFCASV